MSIILINKGRCRGEIEINVNIGINSKNSVSNNSIVKNEFASCVRLIDRFCLASQLNCNLHVDFIQITI